MNEARSSEACERKLSALFQRAQHWLCELACRLYIKECSEHTHIEGRGHAVTVVLAGCLVSGTLTEKDWKNKLSLQVLELISCCENV